MYVRAGLGLALLLGAMGCAKMSAGSAAPDYYEYDDYGGYEGEMAVDAEPAAMEESRSFGNRRSARLDRRAAKTKSSPMAPPPEPTPGGGGQPEASEGTGSEPAVADEGAQDLERYIIYTATMQVSVFNLEDAMERTEALPEKYGGYVQNMSSSFFVIRIPASSLRPLMEELGGLGVVEDRTLDAQDITEEYLDIETRIAVLEGTQKQMMELLTKARTVEEALKVRQALDDVTMELEVLKGRLRRLGSLVAYSTLTLGLIERGPNSVTPSSNDPFPWVDSLGVEATEWK